MSSKRSNNAKSAPSNPTCQQYSSKTICIHYERKDIHPVLVLCGFCADLESLPHVVHCTMSKFPELFSTIHVPDVQSHIDREADIHLLEHNAQNVLLCRVLDFKLTSSASWFCFSSLELNTC